jgi:hypothetical protein
VAFETTWDYTSMEIRSVVVISRADDPAIQFCPIADWQFEKFVVPPEQICLAFAAAANYDIDPLCASNLLEGRKVTDCSFEISLFAFSHFIVKGWIRGSENVLPGAELSQD